MLDTFQSLALIHNKLVSHVCTLITHTLLCLKMFQLSGHLQLNDVPT